MTWVRRLLPRAKQASRDGQPVAIPYGFNFNSR